MRVAGLKNTYDVSLLQREIIIVATGVQAGGARGAAAFPPPPPQPQKLYDFSGKTHMIRATTHEKK